MDETRARIPADATTGHSAGRRLGITEPLIEGDIDRSAIEVLALLGDTEHSRPEPRIGLRRPVGGKYGRGTLADSIQNVGEEIERADIDRADLVRVEIAQER